jgi:predicted phage-related endonuclease
VDFLHLALFAVIAINNPDVKKQPEAISVELKKEPQISQAKTIDTAIIEREKQKVLNFQKQKQLKLQQEKELLASLQNQQQQAKNTTNKLDKAIKDKKNC